jgi:hypothetical protein
MLIKNKGVIMKKSLFLFIIFSALLAFSTMGIDRASCANPETLKLNVPPAVAITEDCVSLNPATTTVAQIKGSWKVVDGAHWVFDFGSNKAAAEKALAVIKQYQISKSCFAERPNPSFTYMLAGDQAPVGALQGENCIKFNPANIQVQQIQEHWKIVDGKMWMYDFGNKKDAADKAFAIIKKYSFDQQCFSAKGTKQGEYLRK